jgi:hypothetical protein
VPLAGWASGAMSSLCDTLRHRQPRLVRRLATDRPQSCPPIHTRRNLETWEIVEQVRTIRLKMLDNAVKGRVHGVVFQGWVPEPSGPCGLTAVYPLPAFFCVNAPWLPPSALRCDSEAS